MTSRPRSASLLVLLGGFAICPAALAAFSDDSAVNLAVADRSGEQTQAKMVAREDGRTYLSWFDNSTGGYDVYLQLLDIDGSELWPHNGVLVADRSFSSTQDYDLAIDTSGNALLAFRDDRGEGVNVTAAAVDIDGNLLWGPGGVQVANGADFVAAPKITGARDATVVVAWTNNDDVVLQKLDQAGEPLWEAPVTLSDAGGGSFSASDLNASLSGSASAFGSTIVSIVRQTNFASPKHLYAQNVAADGSNLWGESPVVVFDGGSLQFGNFPTFVATNDGGAVFAWYDTAAGLKCYVQRIRRTGEEWFQHNGVPVTSSTRDCVNPDIAFDELFDATYVFWSEIQPGPVPQYGVYGQKITSSGGGLWGSEGVAVAALANEELTQIRVVFDEYGDNFDIHGDILVFWVKSLGFDNDRIMAARLDADGMAEWTPAQTTVATSVSGKSRLFAVANVPGRSNPGGFFTLSWSDNRNDANDVYVQNVNGDGSLGTDPVDTDLDGVIDTDDNCILAVNSDQRDTNADGIGNLCDADIDNNCFVNFLDLEFYKASFFTGNNPDTDNDGGGITDFFDLFVISDQFFSQPGPSAIGCDSLP